MRRGGGSEPPPGASVWRPRWLRPCSATISSDPCPRRERARVAAPPHGRETLGRQSRGQLSSLRPTWTRGSALRTDYARRQALVEVDVLVAMALGWILDQLQTAYRSLFFVMRNDERDTWYDAKWESCLRTTPRGCQGGLPCERSTSYNGSCWADVMLVSEEGQARGWSREMSQSRTKDGRK